MKKKYYPSRHSKFKILSRSALVISAIITLNACGGSGSGPTASPTPTTTPTPTVSPTPTTPPTPGPALDVSEIVDPIPSEPLEFIRSVKTLSNGNIVITKPEDSPNGIPAAGSVRIYDGATQINIANIFGDQEYDLLGAGGIVTLGNGNFVILSPGDNVNGIEEAGSIRLINGQTGDQIGNTISGNQVEDNFGLTGVYALNDTTFVVAPINGDSPSMSNVGFMNVISGETGEALSPTFYGSVEGDFINNNVTVLSNGNFAFVTPQHNNAGLQDTGAVHLFNELGEQIGSSFYGEDANDSIGSHSATALANGHYVLASPFDNIAGATTTSYGSVRLINGTTNTEIGTPISEDTQGDLTAIRVYLLPSNNYVLSTLFDDVDGNINAGSVRLVSGIDNKVVGNPLTGDLPNERVGLRNIGVLPNGNYVVATEFKTEGGINYSGSVTLINGTTGGVIGTPVVGTVESDRIGSYVEVLSNGNIAIASPNHDVEGRVDAGSIMLMDGDTGDINPNILVGREGSKLGDSGLHALSNGNFMFVSSNDSSVISNAPVGAIQLMDGLTNTRIGTTIKDGLLGSAFGISIEELVNGDVLLIASEAEPTGGPDDVGVVYSVSSVTGEISGTPYVGAAEHELERVRFHQANDGSFYILNLLFADNHGIDNSGKIIVVQPQ